MPSRTGLSYADYLAWKNVVWHVYFAQQSSFVIKGGAQVESSTKDERIAKR
jgi:hypothetical protein